MGIDEKSITCAVSVILNQTFEPNKFVMEPQIFCRTKDIIIPRVVLYAHTAKTKNGCGPRLQTLAPRAAHDGFVRILIPQSALLILQPRQCHIALLFPT